LSARGKQKKKKGGGAGWRGEKTDGPLGQKGREVNFLSFFSFLFQTLFKSNFFLLSSNQNPSNLFTKFHKHFRRHTSKQKPCKAK
jgi:hypothetical protein